MEYPKIGEQRAFHPREAEKVADESSSHKEDTMLPRGVNVASLRVYKSCLLLTYQNVGSPDVESSALQSWRSNEL
jgi:hypothetical protein